MNVNTKIENDTYRASWVMLIRPLTLTGSIGPALAGGVLATHSGKFNSEIFIAFLVAALLVQMAVNIFNDYFDYLNGQDVDKWKRRDEEDLSKHPTLAQLPKVAISMLLLATALGVWLALQSSFWILIIGALSILAGIYYSAGKHSLSSIGAGELIAAIFLGFIVTGLAYTVETGVLSGSAFVIAIPYAALIASMILVNNIRDIKKDQGFRRTLPISLGRKKAVFLLTVLISLPYLSALVLLLYGLISWKVILVIIALPLAFILRWKLRADAPRVDEQSAMKWAAYHHWVFGLLFVLVIWMG